MKGKTFCWKHGGASLRGPASPTFETGIYSNFLPTRLAVGYEKLLEDKRLLSLRDDAAALVSMIQQAMARMDSGETGALWLELGELWAEVRRAPKEKQGALLNQCGVLIERGASDAAAAREVRSLILDKARVAESERKRLVEAHQVIAMDQFTVLMGALCSAINQEVEDREVRGRILERVDGLLRTSRAALPEPSDERV